MSRAEEYHQWQQIEPNDRLIVGNAKRFEPVKEIEIPLNVHIENLEHCKLTAEDKNRLSDEHLKKFGL